MAAIDAPQQASSTSVPKKRPQRHTQRTCLSSSKLCRRLHLSVIENFMYVRSKQSTASRYLLSRVETHTLRLLSTSAAQTRTGSANLSRHSSLVYDTSCLKRESRLRLVFPSAYPSAEGNRRISKPKQTFEAEFGTPHRQGAV